MARIPDEEIERLKREIPLERLAEARGVVLTRHEADLIGLCASLNQLVAARGNQLFSLVVKKQMKPGDLMNAAATAAQAVLRN